MGSNKWIVSTAKIFADTDAELTKNWRTLKGALGLDGTDNHQLKEIVLHGTSYELFVKILTRWLTFRGEEKANLKELIKILKTEGFQNSASKYYSFQNKLYHMI